MTSRMPHRLLGTSLPVLLAAFVATQPASAQQPGAPGDAAPVAVHGTVYDSVARAPLAGALVQLVDPQRAARTYNATTDSLGTFTMPSVIPGRYAAGFFHPALDVLGIQPPLFAVDVAPGHPASIALAIPGDSTVSAVVCGARAPDDSSGTLVGIVRDADSGTPLPGASVLVTWQETRISARGLQQVQRRVPAQTREDGGYGICGLPGDRLVVSADSGAHRSGLIEVEIPMRGITRRDFLVAGPSAAVATSLDSTAGARTPTVLRGSARLAGVIRKPDGSPMSGARVTVQGSGLSAITGPKGEFHIAGLPAGTFSAQARAIGFTPVTVAVDLASGRTDSVTIMLAKPAATTLAGVTVYGRRPNTFQEMQEFQQRRRQGFGHYLVAADLANRYVVTDALKMVAGLQVVTTGTGVAIYGRGGCDRAGGCGEPGCRPAVFLDGRRLPNEIGRTFGPDGSVSASPEVPKVSDSKALPGDPPDIDRYIEPEQVMGIEVYNGAGGVPPQYQTFDETSGCGVILIWSKH